MEACTNRVPETGTEKAMMTREKRTEGAQMGVPRSKQGRNRDQQGRKEGCTDGRLRQVEEGGPEGEGLRC